VSLDVEVVVESVPERLAITTTLPTEASTQKYYSLKAGMSPLVSSGITV